MSNSCYTSQSILEVDRVRSSMIARLADYVVVTRGQRASGPAQEAAKRCILDLLGAAAAGIAEPGVVAVRRAAQGMMKAGPCALWFVSETSSAVGAAWANSAAASALDLDDGHRMARGHPGAAVIPVAFAVAEEIGASADELINAIVIGYEVGVTIGAARLTYGNTGTWSPYAVVATAAALRQTDRYVLEQAFAIAGESAPNQQLSSAPPQTWPLEGSDVKEGIPWSVVTGLSALQLAETGHTGPRNILDSPLHYRFAELPSIGNADHICGTYFKLYACCRHVHAPLDALIGLMRQHWIEPSSIQSIEVSTYSGALRIANSAKPNHLVDIQYSIPYCLALAALAGPDALLPLTSSALDQPAIVELARKVRLSLDPDLDSRFPKETLARVIVQTDRGTYASDVTSPRGEASSPLSWGDLVFKFRELTKAALGSAAQNSVIETIVRSHGCITTVGNQLLTVTERGMADVAGGEGLGSLSQIIGCALSAKEIADIEQAKELLEIMLVRIRKWSRGGNLDLGHAFRAETSLEES